MERPPLYNLSRQLFAYKEANQRYASFMVFMVELKGHKPKQYVFVSKPWWQTPVGIAPHSIHSANPKNQTLVGSLECFRQNSDAIVSPQANSPIAQ